MGNLISRQILDAMESRLRRIRAVNGFNSDFGIQVFRHRIEEISINQLPCVCFWDVGESVGIGGSDTVERTLTVEIEAVTYGHDEDLVNAALDLVREDLEKAIGSDDQWGGLAETTELSEWRKDFSKKEYMRGSVLMVVTIEFRTQRWDPAVLAG
jgi:hypothetical protein